MTNQITSMWTYYYAPKLHLWVLELNGETAYFPTKQALLEFGHLCEANEIEAEKQADRAHEILCS